MAKQEFKEIWFRGLSAEDKDSLKRALISSILAERLRSILQDWKRELPVNTTDYDSPSWSHKQAHKNGQEEILTRLLSILEIPDQGNIK